MLRMGFSWPDPASDDSTIASTRIEHPCRSRSICDNALTMPLDIKPAQNCTFDQLSCESGTSALFASPHHIPGCPVDSRFKRHFALAETHPQ
jgi:hypothetical protein